MSELSVGLSCPACGGALSIEEGENTINCKYCGSTLFVEGDKGVQTIAFKSHITKENALQVSESWWRKGWKARDLKKTGKIDEVYPIYLPFWSTTVRVVGWVCGYEERTRSGPKGQTYTERVPKESMVLSDFKYGEIACDPGDLGIKTLKNSKGERTLADFDLIPTFETTTSKDDALEDAKVDAIAWGRENAHVPHITFERIHAFPKSMSIIYYPIWVVRYSYRDRMYVSTVDGVTGEILSGRAPGDPLFQSLAMTVGSAVGGIASAGGVLLAAFANTEESYYFAVIGFAVGLGVLYFTYRFFRHGSEITEGEFGKKSAGVGETIKEFSNVAKQLGVNR
ncbi:MAG: hypothetical protein LUO79_09270 [Methanomassiliicoccales archaeon]|nr:hypothetical protein [Methanomassiliicoccales archaeon]